MSFDPVEICAVLSEEGVEFVVLGGFAAIIHGSPLPTEDIDVIPSRSGANLERLATALKRLEAKIRTGDEPIETRIDAAFILTCRTCSTW
jgi:folate-dependent phosphoribosylglycinamide formyltransferase PurN